MRNKPRIRFKGFTEDWEQRKLGDIATITGGGTPSTNISEYWNGDIDWYSPVEIGEKRYASGSIRKITKLGLEKSSAKILPVGTVLFTSRAGIGNTAILQVEGCTNQGFQSITPNSKELDTYFLYTMTPKLKRYGEVTGAGSTFVEVSGKQMEQMNLMIPSLDEQKHVSQLFKVMDDAITLHQRKLEKLKLAKKALLQKLFPKNGSQFPEIRFKGFTDAWEQRKLDDVFQIIDGDRGKNYPGTGDFLSNGDVLFLDTGNVRKDGFNFDNKRYIDFNRDKLLRNGRLILGDYVLTSRGTLGNLAYYSQSIYNRYPQIRINSAMLILRVMNTIKVNNLYLYITLRSNVINEFMRHNFVGSAQPHITKKEFSSVLLPIPRQLEEQKIIGDFFDKLEKIITLHQRKLERLQEVKKGLLQKMFV